MKNLKDKKSIHQKKSRSDVAFEKYTKRILDSPDASHKFLVDLGVVDNNGEILERYSKVCIPIGQI